MVLLSTFSAPLAPHRLLFFVALIRSIVISMRKAVFFDRDGIIIELPKGDPQYGFTYKKEDCHIVPGTEQALTALKEKGFLRIVFTNQPCIARGLVSIEEMDRVHEFINQQLGGLIDAFYTCPHHPEMHPDVPKHAKKYRIPCTCRKPAPGLILNAAKDLDIDLRKSWAVGDLITDTMAGHAAGCKTILVSTPATGRRIVSSHSAPENFEPDFRVKSLEDAVRIVVST